MNSASSQSVGDKRKLTLQRFGLENVNYSQLGAFRLRVEASDPDSTGADPNIFIYLRSLPNPYDGFVPDYFQGITSVVDLSEYPVGAPNGHTTYPMFRTSVFELDLRSIHLANSAWQIILAETATLLQALDAFDTLVLTDTVEVG